MCDFLTISQSNQISWFLKFLILAHSQMYRTSWPKSLDHWVMKATEIWDTLTLGKKKISIECHFDSHVVTNINPTEMFVELILAYYWNYQQVWYHKTDIQPDTTHCFVRIHWNIWYIHHFIYYWSWILPC